MNPNALAENSCRFVSIRGYLPPAADRGHFFLPTSLRLAPQILDIDGFIARVEPFFKEDGFYEKEIARRTEQFGNIAHVWSSYACRAVALRRRESRHNEDDPEPFMRGINPESVRGWIVNIYWQQESAETPIPKKYLN